jgi:hypothetical protein
MARRNIQTAGRGMVNAGNKCKGIDVHSQDRRRIVERFKLRNGGIQHNFADDIWFPLRSTKSVYYLDDPNVPGHWRQSVRARQYCRHAAGDKILLELSRSQ